MLTMPFLNEKKKMYLDKMLYFNFEVIFARINHKMKTDKKALQTSSWQPLDKNNSCQFVSSEEQ